MYNARAQLLFRSLNLLFGDVLVAVVVVVCLSSLLYQPPSSRKVEGFDVPWTEILNFFNSHIGFLLIFGQSRDNYK